MALIETWRLLRRKLSRSPPVVDVSKDSFCIRPFRSFNVVPSGATKICCVFENFILEDGRPMSVYEHSFEEMWNSADVRGIRRAMVEGRHVEGCEYCYRQERQGLDSERLQETRVWQYGWANEEGETIDDIKKATSIDGHQAGGPHELYIDLGNLCNLKCRTCSGALSSSIERDPVHQTWSAPLQGPVLARWKDGAAVIAPNRVLGVEYRGIGDIDFAGEQPIAWTDGDARITMDTTGTDIAKLAIDISPEKADELALSIHANDVEVFAGPLPRGPWHAELDLPKLDSKTLELRIRSWRGVGITSLKVIRAKTSPKKGVAFTRLSTATEWFRNDGFLYQELLGRLRHPASLNVIGGEPLINADMLTLMRHLVENGTAAQTSLALTTNATVVRDDWCELAGSFKELTIAVSMDGYGDVLEYIRFPAKWEIATQNLQRLRRLPHAKVYVHATIQAYNILGIADLFAWCDRKGIPFRYHVLEYPRMLHAWTMPENARIEAARRLRVYLRDCTNREKEHVTQLADALEKGDTDLVALRDFMAFTNDLDATRDQTFAKVHPDLLRLIEESAVPWSKETRYARLAKH